MSKIKTLIIFMFTTGFITNALAIAPFYKIDIIVFSHITAESLNSEQWPIITDPTVAIPAKPFFNNVLTQNINQLGQSTHLNQPKLLTPSNAILKNEERRLTARPGYKTLLHITWLQPTAQLDRKVTLHIYGGNLYDGSGKIVGNATGLMAPYLQNGNTWELNGLITLYLDRFFNFNINLVLAEPTARLTSLLPYNSTQYFANNNSTFTYFRLLATRRMRSDELNYIDHPLYGVLIETTPVNN